MEGLFLGLAEPNGADSEAYNKDEKERVKVKLSEIAAMQNNL